MLQALHFFTPYLNEYSTLKNLSLVNKQSHQLVKIYLLFREIGRLFKILSTLPGQEFEGKVKYTNHNEKTVHCINTTSYEVKVENGFVSVFFGEKVESFYLEQCARRLIFIFKSAVGVRIYNYGYKNKVLKEAYLYSSYDIHGWINLKENYYRTFKKNNENQLCFLADRSFVFPPFSSPQKLEANLTKIKKAVIKVSECFRQSLEIDFVFPALLSRPLMDKFEFKAHNKNLVGLYFSENKYSDGIKGYYDLPCLWYFQTDNPIPIKLDPVIYQNKLVLANYFYYQILETLENRLKYEGQDQSFRFTKLEKDINQACSSDTLVFNGRKIIDLETSLPIPANGFCLIENRMTSACFQVVVSKTKYIYEVLMNDSEDFFKINSESVFKPALLSAKKIAQKKNLQWKKCSTTIFEEALNDIQVSDYREFANRLLNFLNQQVLPSVDKFYYSINENTMTVDYYLISKNSSHEDLFFGSWKYGINSFEEIKSCRQIFNDFLVNLKGNSTSILP